MQYMKIPRTKSLNELNTLALKKQNTLKSMGFEYVCIWEHDILLQSDEQVKTFVDQLDIQPRLNPRDSFFGGRKNCIQPQHKISDNEKIKYYDVTSLYPWVQKYCKYGVKEPKIITKDFKDIGDYFGIAQVKVLPPRKLFFPVLPTKINKKLVLSFCRTCTEKSSQNPCSYSDDARSFIGTWCTPELIKARKGVQNFENI